MNTPNLADASSRELEIECLRRKITAQETAFHRALQTVADIHEAQLGRMRELGIQEEQLRVASGLRPDGSAHSADATHDYQPQPKTSIKP